MTKQTVDQAVEKDVEAIDAATNQSDDWFDAQFDKLDQDAQRAAAAKTIDATIDDLRAKGHGDAADYLASAYGSHPGLQEDASDEDIGAVLAMLFGDDDVTDLGDDD